MRQLFTALFAVAWSVVAFAATPTIEGTSTYYSQNSPAGDFNTGAVATTHPFPIPTGTQDDDLLVACIALGSSSLTSTFTGWTLLDASSRVSNKLEIYYRVAASEGATTTFSLSGSGAEAAAVIYRITGYEAIGTQAPEVGTAANANSNAPNSPSITPAGGSDDYLYIACAQAGDLGNGGDRAPMTTNSETGFQSFRSDYDNNVAGIATSYNASTATTSHDPAAYAINGGEPRNWVANTVAITPGAEGGGGGGGGPSLVIIGHNRSQR